MTIAAVPRSCNQVDNMRAWLPLLLPLLLLPLLLLLLRAAAAAAPPPRGHGPLAHAMRLRLGRYTAIWALHDCSLPYRSTWGRAPYGDRARGGSQHAVCRVQRSAERLENDGCGPRGVPYCVGVLAAARRTAGGHTADPSPCPRWTVYGMRSCIVLLRDVRTVPYRIRDPTSIMSKNFRMRLSMETVELMTRTRSSLSMVSDSEHASTSPDSRSTCRAG